MAQYLRTFLCRICSSHAKLEQKREGLTVVCCPTCHIKEIWEEEVFQMLKNFAFLDTPVVEC
jgi:hypothetical protein